MYLARTIVVIAFTTLGSPLWAEQVILAVATNFAETAEALAENFASETGHNVDFAFGSTGKIYAQILNGAPFDGFLAADQERPKLLFEEGLGEAPFTYARGVLVWWPDLEGRDPTGKIAIANPELAPYGLAAQQVLESMEVWAPWRDQLVLGENVGQAFAMVFTGNAELGLVALSSVKSQRNSKDWTWSLAKGHGPIRQDAILLNKGRHNPAAIEFMTYLKSEEAQTIIERFGYGVMGHD